MQLVQAPSSSASDVAVRTCAAGDLSAKQTGSGAGMSQPFVVITLTNTSGTACALDGYPAITGMWTKHARKTVHVTRGNLGNMTDPGVSRFVVAPGGHAWFAVGAATAYDPPVVTFRRVVFSVGAGPSVVAKVQLEATAPRGKAFPIGVTAFAPGRGEADA